MKIPSPVKDLVAKLVQNTLKAGNVRFMLHKNTAQGTKG